MPGAPLGGSARRKARAVEGRTRPAMRGPMTRLAFIEGVAAAAGAGALLHALGRGRREAELEARDAETIGLHGQAEALNFIPGYAPKGANWKALVERAADDAGWIDTLRKHKEHGLKREHGPVLVYLRDEAARRMRSDPLTVGWSPRLRDRELASVSFERLIKGVYGNTAGKNLDVGQARVQMAARLKDLERLPQGEAARILRLKHVLDVLDELPKKNEFANELRRTAERIKDW